MAVENIFEYATRNKVRFSFRGLISVEDLWDLSLTNLDSIYKELNKQSKQSEEESLLNIKTQEDELLNVQIDIVKHIVSVKLAEKEERELTFEIGSNSDLVLENTITNNLVWTIENFKNTNKRRTNFSYKV